MGGSVQILDQVSAANSTPTLATHGVPLWADKKGWYGGLARGTDRASLVVRNVDADAEVKIVTARLWLMFNVKSRAKGTLTAVSKAEHVDGETFTLDDGRNTATIFEIDEAGDGVVAGNVAVDISGATTNEDCAAIIAAAINSQTGPGFRIRATVAAEVVSLENLDPGTAGNTTSAEDVTDATFVLTDMAGGRDFVWAPVGTSATVTLKGVLNEETALEETESNVVAHVEPVVCLQDAARAYLEVGHNSTTVTGTFSAWLVAGGE